MSKDTLQAAIDRVKQTHTAYRFLVADEVIPGKNVLFIRRIHDARNQPYIPTLATVVGITPSRRVKLSLYASGNWFAYADLQAVFTDNSSWCREEPIFSHCYYENYVDGVVYWKRLKYTKRYPKEWETDEVERRTEQDWKEDPKLFGLVDNL